MRVLLIAGFTEGNWHVQGCERALKERGFSLTKDITSADYVMAHSGGCYTIPPLKDNQVLMLINPPYWPGRSIAERSRAMTWQLLRAIRPGNQPIYQLWKTIHNVFYLFYHFRLNWLMAQRSKSYNLDESINHSKTILVRNQNDPWLTPQLDNLQKLHPNLRIVTMPGDHDDFWQHPAPYIDLLQEYR